MRPKHRHLIETPSAQLEKVRAPHLSAQAINGGVGIGPYGQEGEVDGRHPKGLMNMV
jgi:hypothetical protein